MYPRVKAVIAKHVVLIATENTEISILRNDEDHYPRMHLRKSVSAAVTSSHLLDISFGQDSSGSLVAQCPWRRMQLGIVDSDLSAEPNNLQGPVHDNAAID